MSAIPARSLIEVEKDLIRRSRLDIQAEQPGTVTLFLGSLEKITFHKYDNSQDYFVCTIWTKVSRHSDWEPSCQSAFSLETL